MKAPVLLVLELKGEKAKSNVSTNLILWWKGETVLSLMLHMISVSA